MAQPATASAAASAARAAAADGVAASAAWRIIPRPLLETVLHNHALHPRVPQPLLLHGPRGVGKTSLVLHRLLPEWNKGPHAAAYVDFAADPSAPRPWASCSVVASMPSLVALRERLESELEALATRAILLGSIGSRDVFATLNKWHGFRAALSHVIGSGHHAVAPSLSLSALWAKAVLSFSARHVPGETETMFGEVGKKYSMEEAAYVREAAVALRLAKEVIRLQQDWRRDAVWHLNQTGMFSRSLANSATDWPCLLIEILSEAAEVDFFQPKLILNNIDVLRKATLNDDSTIPAAMYHDSLIWRVIALGANERCLPVILVTSDRYYSYQAFVDFGFPDIFISRETFGWTNQEAKLHMVTDFFSEHEWKIIAEVLGTNLRQLSELYLVKQSANCRGILHGGNSFEDIVDAYLAYLQVSVVNPAMELALSMLQQFASDVHEGKIPESRLHFGAPWRHPPRRDNPSASQKWAKIQLMDFVQSFVTAEFGVNYLADDSLEILDDPAVVAMLEVGLLYEQRDPSFIRPITCGIQRCLARWFVQQKMQLSLHELVAYKWQRIMRGRSYRHLMKEIGYK